WTAAVPRPWLDAVESPTHVGMDRSVGVPHSAHAGEPHARGDGPSARHPGPSTWKRAPRTWGWTGGDRRTWQSPHESPTHVGMDRRRHEPLAGTRGEPHARGDGPRPGSAATPASRRAPRTWGWTAPARPVVDV